MTDDVKERCAAESAAIAAARKHIYIGDDADGDPVLIGLEDGIRAALSALRPGDEIGECVLVPKAAVSDLVRSITEVRPGEMWTAASFDNFEAFRAALATAKKG